MTAQLWTPLPQNKAQCLLCQHHCVIEPNTAGLCGVRANAKGQLYSLVADRVASVHMDPVEKKPLYHYRPGTTTFSVGTVGCNFACAFCQNHAISRTPVDTGQITGTRTTPLILASEAEKRGARSVAFTYNEPTVFFELMYATAGAALARGLECLMVTNGYQSLECLSALCHRIHAVNVDLKSFREDFYRKHCKARLTPVLDTLKTMVELGWWTEVTTLIIPGCNDSDDELRDIARFIHHELGAHVPWHLSRFFGAYRMQSHPQTPVATLERAWHIGKQEGLHFVYVGNVDAGLGNNTLCPSCGAVCLERHGYRTRNLLKGDACPKCGMCIPGIWPSI